MEKKELSHLTLRAVLIGLALSLLLNVSVSRAISYTHDSSADSPYAAALELYGLEEFEQAAAAFAGLSADFPYDARITTFKLLQAKALFYDAQVTASEIAFKRLINAHQKSRYIPACHYFLGRIHYLMERYDSSALAFAKAVELSRDNEQTQIYGQNLLAVAEGRLDAEQTENLLTKARGYNLTLGVGLSAAEKYYALHGFDQANVILDRIIAAYPQASDEEGLKGLRKKIELFASQKAVIALFAPISGELAGFGRMMSNAADLAFEEYNDDPGFELERKTYDTFGNSIASAIKAKELTGQPVSAIIGPLSSAEAVGVAAYADINDVPLIAPTASEKGLTGITDMLFQLTPTPERMGEALADFITSELNFDSVAVLSPLDNYGKQITDGFVHRMLDSGATVFYQKFYPRGSRDYRRFLLDLKKELLPDTFVAEIFLNRDGDTMEVEEIPVRVPALFLPSYTSELKLILPQLRFYKISTILLGADPFGETEILEMNENRDNPTFFVSKAVYLPEDSAWLKFAFLYQRRFDEPPQRVAAITYDAVKMVLECISQGMYTSEEVWRCFMEKREYRGASGIIRFNAQRENSYVPVYLLSEGEIIRM
jgi:branched-chain amino acid transport system substrate-binding protein